MKAKVYYCLIGLSVMSICCSTTSSFAGDKVMIDVDELVRAIKNEDINWDGNYFGLYPTVGGASRLVLLYPKQKAVPYLIQSLDHPDQFVAAHVILAMLSGSIIRFDAETWGGLHVDLAADGSVSFPQQDAAALKRHWLEVFEVSCCTSMNGNAHRNKRRRGRSSL